MSEPGWGHPHVHDFKPTKQIGSITIERCKCGAVRHVIERENQ